MLFSFNLTFIFLLSLLPFLFPSFLFFFFEFDAATKETFGTVFADRNGQEEIFVESNL